MGAQLWHHQAPWHPEAGESLKALQHDYIHNHYDLATLFSKELDSTKKHLEAELNAGDEFGLVEWLQTKIERLVELNANPIPDDIDTQIQIIREVLEYGEGLCNVLDISGISEKREVFKAVKLTDVERTKFVGCLEPNVEQANASVGKINHDLNRGECVCFPIFQDGKPIGWYFVGNTID